MRLAPFCALLAVGALLAPRADAQCTGVEGTDFSRVDISEITAIPQANIDQLNAAGADLLLEDTQDLITSAFEGQGLVEFTGVIMSDPLLSGVRSLNADGVPNSIQYWVRDSDALTTGFAGQSILINDEAGDGYARGLNQGLEVTVCGSVAPFITGGGTGAKILQISPLAGTAGANVVGAFPLDDPLLAPVTITTDDIHDLYVVAGENLSQIDWNIYSDFVGQYVRFEAIDLVQGIPGDRPNMLFSTPGQDTQVNSSDNSVCFGNRRGPEYYPTGPVPECITDGPFVPPPTGVVNLQGFLIFSGYDGPFDFAIPANGNWTVLPWAASDFEVTTSPPAVTVQGPTTIPGPSDNVTITITATPGDGTVTSVVVNYQYRATGQMGQVTATNTSGDTYEATIPAGPVGFVSYSATATDSNGASTTTDTQSYRIFSGPITDIVQIQETFDGGPGDSPFFTGASAPIEINLVARVQSVIPVGDGSNFLLILQDDATLAPFTGIWAFVGPNAAGYAAGDELTITGAELDENFGVTQLSGLTATVSGTPGPYPYKVVETSVLTASNAAEQHEGMMIRFENVTITDVNADGPDDDNGFGEWQFSTSGTEADEVRADDNSANIPNDFNLMNFEVGQGRAFMQGAWTFSFGNYKLIPVEVSDIGAIVTAGDDAAGATALGLSVSPNPMGTATTVRFETPAAGPVSLRVFDVTGRQVATLVDGELAAGEASAAFDASGLAAGVYVVRLQAGTTVATQQVTVVR